MSPNIEAADGRAARYIRIVEVLAKHGFELLDEELVHHAAPDATRAVQLREALEEIGTVAVKLGQFVASQSGSLPEPYRVELAKLDDDVPPVPTEVIRRTIEEALGSSIDRLFATFDDKPIGTASIGQVHGATLEDGTAVVVKVKKPGTDALVATDLSIAHGLVDRLTPHVSLLRDMRADALMPAFVRTLETELDFGAEAANVRYFADHFKNDAGIAIPELIEDRTSGPVICETRLSGPPLLQAASKNNDEALRARISELTVWLVLEPGLTAGTFHADPHAGNLLWTEDDRLGVIDFGKVGRLSMSDRRHIISMFSALGSHDPDRLTAALMAIAVSGRPVDQHGLVTDVGDLLNRYGSAAIGRIDFRSALHDLLTLLREHDLSIPGDVVLFFKALAMSEGLIRRIRPDARFSGLLRPVLKRLMLERFTRGDIFDRLTGWGIEAGTALADLPAQVDRALTSLNRGELQVWTRVDGIEPTVRRIEGMVDRLTAAVLVAAAMIGTAVVLQVYRPPLRLDFGVVPWVLLGIVLSFVVRAVSRRIGRRKRVK